MNPASHRLRPSVITLLCPQSVQSNIVQLGSVVFGYDRPQWTIRRTVRQPASRSKIELPSNV